MDDQAAARISDQIAALQSLLDARLKALEQTMDDRHRSTGQTLTALSQTVAGMNGKMESTYVRRDVYDGDKRSLWTDVNETKDSLRWAMRIAVSAFLLPLLASACWAIVAANLR